MPAEWARHEATWLTWPKNKVTWPGNKLAQVEEIYIQMILGLLPGERVNLLVSDAKTAEDVLSRMAGKSAKLSNLIFHRAKTTDTWIRDYGPIFVKKVDGIQKTEYGRQKTEDRNFPSTVSRLVSSKAFVKFIFNAWGGKYSDLARDNGVVDRLPTLKQHHRFDAPIVLEGGSIDLDGQGTCLTTEQCLLNPNRNPFLSRRDLERVLEKYLGVTRVIWLKDGIEADDTDGHVDDVTRFVAPHTVVTVVEPNVSDKINHHALSENLDILRAARDAAGKRLKIIELPMPGLVGPGRSDTKHRRLPASYANFYIGNASVLLPVYSHRNDRAAVRILKKIFPTRKIIPIECSALVYGLGSIHCVTQQEPA